MSIFIIFSFFQIYLSNCVCVLHHGEEIFGVSFHIFWYLCIHTLVCVFIPWFSVVLFFSQMKVSISTTKKHLCTIPMQSLLPCVSLCFKHNSCTCNNVGTLISMNKIFSKRNELNNFMSINLDFFKTPSYTVF